MEHSHRSTFTSKHKRFKGKSKGKIKLRNGGKVDSRDSIKCSNFEGSKNDRYNRSRQLQRQKREETILKKRLGTRMGPPKIVALIALGEHVDLKQASANLRTGCEAGSSLTATNPLLHVIRTSVDKKQQNVMIYETPRTLPAALDIAKVADIVLYVLTPDTTGTDLGVDHKGFSFLQAIKSQGFTTHIGLMQGLDRVPPKKRNAAKKLLTRYFQTAMDPAPKVLPIDSPQDGPSVFRWLGNLRIKNLSWRENRPYMLGHTMELHQTSTETATVRVSGYLRGPAPFSANRLVHVTGFGDFQLEKIESVKEAMNQRTSKRDRKAAKKAATAAAGGMDVGGNDNNNSMNGNPAVQTSVLEVADSVYQESMQSLQELDEFAHEQSLFTEEELRAIEGEEKTKGNIQAVWDALVSDDESEDGEQEKEKEKEKEQKKVQFDGMDDENDDEVDEILMAQLTANESNAELLDPVAKQRMERDAIDFPDEIDFPRSTKVRVRFQKYRGLQSFRHSPWDNKESLPLEYGQIFQFEDFAATQKNAVQTTLSYGQPAADADADGATGMSMDSDGGASTSSKAGVNLEDYRQVLLYLKDVPLAKAQQMCDTAYELPICVWGLHQHEHKVSLLHFAVKRFDNYTLPIKAKEAMLFDVGFRRFVSRPIYSEHSTSKTTKYKSERFFLEDTFMVASVYQRITYLPAPVLMFKANSLTMSSMDGDSADNESMSSSSSSSPSPNITVAAQDQSNSSTKYPPLSSYSLAPSGPLIASGSLLGVNADRMIIKRIVLTGYPISSHKRNAVVRYMFFNAEDTRWFQKVELWTKYGLTGHIKETRGTKGYMKCLFDGHIKQHDTVCMSLYKRQYPPFDATDF